ncbi:pilus assembly protein PilM [Chloroflexota bacterium]
MAEVTLFIEDNEIRLLVAKGRRVEKWAKMPLEPGLVSDGAIIDEPQVAEKLKELFKLEKVGVRTVVAALSGFNSVYRLISLPELPAAILPEAVEQEASRVVPVPMDQVYLAYQSIPASPGETQVFLAAYPRNATDSLLRTLAKAGLRADYLDLAPLALCRTVDAPEAVVIHASSVSLDITIMVERIPQVIRSLSLPGETQSLTERLETIVEELNRTIAFYNTGHRDKPLEASVPVFVSGDLALAPDTWPSLSGKAGYPVSVVPSQMSPLEGFDDSQFMVNIGLALKHLTVEKEANISIVNFNALPQAEKPKKKASPLAILLPIVIVLGVGGVYYMYNNGQNAVARNDVVRSQLELVQSQIPQQQEVKVALEQELVEIEPEIEPLKAEANMYQATFSDLEQGRNRINQDVTHIANLVPEQIALIYGGDVVVGYATPSSAAAINHTGDNAIVEGRSQDLASVFQYARDLRSSGGFTDVTIMSIETYEEVVTPETDTEEEVVVKGYNFQFALIQ